MRKERRKKKTAPFGLQNVSRKYEPKKIPPHDFYKRLMKKGALLVITKYLFSPRQWQNHYDGYFRNRAIVKKLRLLIQIDTVVAFQRRKFYRLENEENSLKSVKVNMTQRQMQESLNSVTRFGNDYSYKQREASCTTMINVCLF